MNEYIPILNLVLNVLLLPLLAMQWRTRVDLATANATITALSQKLDVADAEIKQLRERMHKALNGITSIEAVMKLRQSERMGEYDGKDSRRKR